MNFEERRCRAEKLMQTIDDICHLEYAYCEMEEDVLRDNLRTITGATAPSLWKWSYEKGRSAGYAAMFSKLLLTYLLSEIKNGNLLDVSFLDKIKHMEVEPYKEFLFIDSGYQTAYVLERIMHETIKQKDYFEIETFPIDLPEELEDDEESMREECYKAFISDCPDIKDRISSENFDIFAYNLNFPDYEVEIEKIYSKILYQIKMREKKTQTIEGTEIIENSCLFEHILHKELTTMDISCQADLNGTTAFYVASASSIFGDDSYFRTFALERHHRYCYSTIFEVNSLIKKITDYKRRYLDK